MLLPPRSVLKSFQFLYLLINNFKKENYIYIQIKKEIKF